MKTMRFLLKITIFSFDFGCPQVHPVGKFRPREVSKLISMDKSPLARAIPINLKTVVDFVGGWCP